MILIKQSALKINGVTDFTVFDIGVMFEHKRALLKHDRLFYEAHLYDFICLYRSDACKDK